MSESDEIRSRGDFFSPSRVGMVLLRDSELFASPRSFRVRFENPPSQQHVTGC